MPRASALRRSVPIPKARTTVASSWAVDGDSATSRLRLCFGSTTKEGIRDGVAAFARVCYEQTGIPEQSGNIRHAVSRSGH